MDKQLKKLNNYNKTKKTDKKISADLQPKQ